MTNHKSILNLTALALALALVGCASDKKEPVAAAPAQPTATPDDRPGKAQAELMVITATVKAIDKKKRVVTLQFPDGKTSKVKCGPEVRNFAQIRVGDEVRVSLLESVELFVADEAEEPAAGRTAKVARAPKGERPGFAAVESVEVRATVESIDYKTREVVLKGPEGKLQKIKAGPAVKRLNEIRQGDTVVARLTQAVSITVNAPQ